MIVFSETSLMKLIFFDSKNNWIVLRYITNSY